MKYRIIQWRVKVGSENMAMFTQTHDRYVAMAIALATFGHEVSELQDEGVITQHITEKTIFGLETSVAGGREVR